MRIWQMLLVATAFGVGLPAFAQSAGKPEVRNEVEAKMRERLDRFDANHDGVVTREEIMSFTDTRMKAHEADEFASMDANHDGMISRTEFDDYHAKVRGLMRADGIGGDHIGPMAHHDDVAIAAGDRIVIADEVKRALARFDLMDTNHDGVVSPEERRAYRAMHDGSLGAPGK